MEAVLEIGDLLKLLENNKRLISLRDISKMSAFILDEAIRITQAERGFIVFFQGETLEVAAARNYDKESLQKAEQKISSTLLAQVKSSGKPLLLMDAEKDNESPKSESILKMGLRSVLCVPIRLDELSLGVLYLDNRFRKGAFHQAQIRLLELFASQAALSLNAIQSLDTAERHAKEMEALQGQLAELNAILQERVATAESERDQVRALLDSPGGDREFPGIIGRSKKLREVLKVIRQLKDAAPTVYIHGESGTGKELIARALHRNSLRSRGPFLAINCAAFSENLLDSELFGHVRGAFTGAERSRHGLFEEAQGGTLFLDEVGEMPPGMQAKLLRVLQEGEVRPVGSNQTQKVDVRILCASNRDLKLMSQEGSFREDLYFRLNVVRIDLPALRERPEDIPALVKHFMDCNSQGIPASILAIDQQALDMLTRYAWPGNIRELQNEIERALIMGKGHIQAKLLSSALQSGPAPIALADLGVKGLTELVDQVEREKIQQALEASRGNKLLAAKELRISRGKLYQLLRKHGMSPQLGRLTALKIKRALREAKGNKLLAAKNLGIARRTLYHRLKELK